MTFDYPGYEIKFIQKRSIKDGTAHLFTFVYKFHSPVTKYNYIINADYHQEDVFAVKFYCKKDKRSIYKYSKIVNKGDLPNILMTCAKIVPVLLLHFPNASFGFASARTVDIASKKAESFKNNQRFRIYRQLIPLKFGNLTFAHYEYEEISAYLLLNRCNSNIELKELNIKIMLTETYNELHDL